jgi:hypothetical protein
VVAMVAAAIVAPAAALSGVNLAVNSTTIGATPTATTITFTVGAAIGTSPNGLVNGIVVTFGSGFTVPAGAFGTTKISTSNGIGSTAITNVAINANAVGQVVTLDTTTAGVGYIGAGAIIQLTFNNIVNPSTIGAFGVTVATASETTAVASNTITTTAPTILPVPGIITVWNSAGIELAQTTDFNVALTAVTAGGTIKLAAGTYNTNWSANANLALSMTIQGTDPSAANVILMCTAPWALTGKTVVVNALTIDGSGPGALTIQNGSASGSDTISGCILQKGTLTVNDAAGTVCTLSNDTFTTKTGGSVGLTATTPATVTGCTFNVAGTSWGISAAANVTVTGSTFTGVAETTDTYLGNGISVTGGAGNAISTSTFTGLTNALTVNGGTAMANFFSNTVTNCGEASPPALTATDQTTSAIIITSAGVNGVNIYGNTITNGTYYVLSVAAGQDGNVNFYQNTLTGNAKVASNDDLNSTLMLTKNWWGGAANVPANVKNVAGTTAGLTFAPALGAAPSATAFAISGNLSASATVGVTVSGVGNADAPYEIGATALAGNPTAIAIPSADTATKYFDVYGQTATGGNLTTGATIDFYGTTASPVVNTATSQSAVLFYNPTTGMWVNAGGIVNTFGNYVEIYLGSGQAGTAGMSLAQFNGTPFVLVTVAIPLGGVAPTATPLYPVNGAVNVPVANLTFTWPAVSGSGVTYQFALAQASANTSANEFAILDYSDNTMTNAEPSQETLAYNTVYWWEVRAVTMNSSGGIAATGPWSIQMFTTMPMPTTTTNTPAVTITQTNTSVIVTQPVTTVQSTVTSVVITQTTGTSSPAIPSYLLWAVIAVGAILVIAVIVLIVRTRRIP